MDFFRHPFSILFLLSLQLTLTACKQDSSSVPTDELFLGVMIEEREVGGVPSYTVVKGVNHIPNLDTQAFPDIRSYYVERPLKISNESFSATYLGETQGLVRAGSDILRMVLERNENESTPPSSYYTDLFTTQFPSLMLDAPLTVAFHRATGETVSLDINPPERAVLSSPVESVYYGKDDDFEISWSAGSGYKVEISMETISEREVEHHHRMFVPVEEGSIQFSDFKQNFIDVYGAGAYLPMFGTVKVSVQSRYTQVMQDTAYRLAAAEIKRLESSVMIEIEQ